MKQRVISGAIAIVIFIIALLSRDTIGFNIAVSILSSEL